MSNDDFNDDLSDMLGGKGPVATPKQPPASYIPLRSASRRRARNAVAPESSCPILAA